MHELGILRHVLKTAADTAKKNNISELTYITLEVGEDSGCVPLYLEKMFPAAVQMFPDIGKPQLKLLMVRGKILQIKEIGYEHR